MMMEGSQMGQTYFISGGVSSSIITLTVVINVGYGCMLTVDMRVLSWISTVPETLGLNMITDRIFCRVLIGVSISAFKMIIVNSCS
jgi:hypothetical protein